MAGVGAKVGVDFHLYRNSGNFSSPVWNLISVVRDVKLNMTKGEVEAASRLSRWKQMLPGLKEVSLEYELLRDNTNTNTSDYFFLEQSFMNDSILDMAVSDGVINATGTEYFRSDFYCTGFARSEPLEDKVTVAVKQVIAYSTNPNAFTQL